MRVLVTGGSGFLGRYLVEQLLERGDQVRVLCRHPDPALEALGVDVVQGDVADKAAVLLATCGVERVFHVAAKVGFWGRYADFHRTNVTGTRHVIDACLDNGVQRLIYTSSPSVTMNNVDIHNGDESLPYPAHYHSHYSATKAEAERYVLAANGRNGLVTTAIRPHLILGPRDNHLIPRLLDKARRGRLRQIGPGTNKVSVVYVENAAHAHLLAADSDNVGGKAYFINEAEPLLLWPWINSMLVRLDLKPARRKVPFTLAFQAGRVFEWLHRLLPFLGEPLVTRFLAAELYRNHYFSTRNAEQDFGYHPRVNFADAEAITLDWFRHWLKSRPA